MLDKTRLPKLNIQLLALFSFYTVLLVTFHWQTSKSLILLWWQSFTYGHGLLVIPVALYLIFEKRHQVFTSNTSPSLLGVLALVGVGVIWLMVFLIDVMVVQQLILFFLFATLVWAMLGWVKTKKLLFPLSYLLVAMPIWDPLEPILQYSTANIVAKSLLLFGVPTYLEGDLITIPEGVFQIEDACAGLRYVLAALAIGLLYSYIFLKRFKYQLLLVAFSLILAVLVNWIRVFFVILAGHLTNMQHYLVKSHADFGWWLFVICLFLIFYYGKYLKKKQGELEKHVGANVQDGKTDERESSEKSLRSNNVVSKAVPYLAVGLSLVFIPITAFSLKTQEFNRSKFSIPAPAVQSWVGPLDTAYPHGSNFIGADDQINGLYKQNNANVYLYVARYFKQSQGNELIYYGNKFYDDKIWVKVKSYSHTVTLANKHEIRVVELHLADRAGKKMLLWYWYTIAGRHTVSSVTAKFLQFKTYLGDRKVANAVALSSIQEQGVERTRVLLGSFLEQLWPFINKL